MTLNLCKLTLTAVTIVATTCTAHAQMYSSSTSYSAVAVAPSRGVSAPPPTLPNLVTPGDTFQFVITGYNSAGTTGYLLTPQETATFGATTTYTAAGFNGQNITITSSESINGTSTTDTFTCSTPTSFLTTATVNSTTITQLYFEIGTGNAGGNTVDLAIPIATQTSTGSFIYNTNTSGTTTPNTTLSNNNSSYAEYEGVSAGTSAISQFNVHSFTYSITYTNAVASAAAPEPSAVALSLSGAMLMVGGIVRRRRARA